MPTIVLGSICLFAALLLSVINTFTAPIIAERENAKANAALTEVLPGGSNFQKLTLNESYPEAVTEAYSADGGFVFRSVGKGRNGDIVVMIGVNTNGEITGTQIISEGESKGYKEKVFNEVLGTEGKYTGQTLESYSPVLVGGSTMTSNGFAGAVKAALQAYVIANGGSVDTRTPEQILQDNCNAALGTEGKTFTKWFATEALTGIDAVYETEGGRVFVIGESFVGVNEGGEIVTAEVSADNTAAVNAAHTLVSGSTLTELTTLPEGVSKNIEKAYSTSSGNYVFEVKASGYKHATNMEFAGIDDGYFFIKISIGSDGKIIDVITTSHSESNGFGDKCATEEYYEQFRGKENADVTVTVPSPDFHGNLIPDDATGIGVIASSTFTTTGYQKAVKAAFAAFELITNEGGNE